MTVSYSGGFIRLLLRWKGSIWKSVWVEFLVFLAFFYAVRFFYTDGIPRIDPDNKRGLRELFIRISRDFEEYTKQIPLTFLLGFYVSNVVSRWWRQFECLAWPEDILSLVCLALPDSRSRYARHQIARYLNLSAALACSRRDVSSKIRLRYPELPNLIDAGLLTPTELNRLLRAANSSPSAIWLAPIHWSQQIISKEVSSGHAQVLFLSPLANELRSFRVSFRRIFCHDWVCIPLVYTQVAALATYAYFFFCLFARQFLDEDKPTEFIFPLFTSVQFLFFVGWFKVGLDLMRPFGTDDDDIELAYVLDRNLATSFTIVDRLEAEAPPMFEPDVFWQHIEERTEIRTGESNLLWGRIDLTRSNHKHPPKLHAHLELGQPLLTKDDRFVVW